MSYALCPGHCWPQIKSHPWVRTVASAVCLEPRVGQGQLVRPESASGPVLVTWVLVGGSLYLAARPPKAPWVPRGGQMHGGGVPAEGGVGQHELYQWMGV